MARRSTAAVLLAAALCAPLQSAIGLQQPVGLWEEVYVRVRPGATVQARFHLSVQSGFFVVARSVAGPPPLRGLTLKMKQAGEVQLGQPVYPAPVANAEISGAPPFEAYEGVIAVSVPLTVPQKATWTTRRLEGTLEYQACSASGCRPPDTLPVAIEVELRPAQQQ
jgi:hypothetical protein